MQLEEYLQEIKKIKLLQPEQEAVLWQQFKELQDDAARRQLIEAYQPLVFKQAMPFRFLDNVMDLVQEGTVGLIEAVENYDHQRGVAFSLYAVHRIRGRMMNFLAREGKTDHVFASDGLEEDGVWLQDVADTALSVAEQAEGHVLSGKLHDAMERLPQKERMVLENVYFKSAEVRDVAELLNVSTGHIYRLQKSGIRRIRGMLSKFMQHW